MNPKTDLELHRNKDAFTSKGPQTKCGARKQNVAPGVKRAGDHFVAATGKPGTSAKSAGFQSAGTKRNGDNTVGAGRGNDEHEMLAAKESNE